MCPYFVSPTVRVAVRVDEYVLYYCSKLYSATTTTTTTSSTTTTTVITTTTTTTTNYCYYYQCHYNNNYNHCFFSVQDLNMLLTNISRL